MSTDRFGNIAAYLPDMARRQPDSIAIYCPQGRFSPQQSYAVYSYAELEQKSNQMAAALEAVGVKRGVRTVLMVTPSLDFFALTFALFKIGAVPVLVDPGMGTHNLKSCLEEARPAAFIGVPKAHLARRLLGWARNSLSVLITTGLPLWFDEQSMPRLLAKHQVGPQFDAIVPEADETPRGVCILIRTFLPRSRH